MVFQKGRCWSTTHLSNVTFFFFPNCDKIIFHLNWEEMARAQAPPTFSPPPPQEFNTFGELTFSTDYI